MPESVTSVGGEVMSMGQNTWKQIKDSTRGLSEEFTETDVWAYVVRYISRLSSSWCVGNSISIAEFTVAVFQ